MTTAVEIKSDLRAKVPEHTLAALDRYVNEGIPTGDFLYAVLTNNLVEACGRADHINQAALFDIVTYVYNEVPVVAWGSPAKVKAWLEYKHEKKLAEAESGGL